MGPLLFNIFINDVFNIFQHSNALLYADDTKIFIQIKDKNDCSLLQKDLNNLTKYCEVNNLFLNVDKCYVISFTRKNKPIENIYTLSDKTLKRVNEVRDLGVYLDSQLLFRAHIDRIVAKAYKMLGFVLRQGSEFKNASTFIILYNAFVRSHLEYASTTWNPIYSVYIDSIERIQNKFLKVLRYRQRQNNNFKYNPETVKPLVVRRDINDFVFLYKIINNICDSPYLLGQIGFKCRLFNSRSSSLFHIAHCSTNYAKNRFIVRACSSYNQMYNDIDIFQKSLYKIKNDITCIRK